MPVHHGVIDDGIHMGVVVRLSFLKDFWLHRHLGIDVTIVDTYSWALVDLLFPTEEGNKTEVRKKTILEAHQLYIPTGMKIIQGSDRVSPKSLK